MCKTAGHGIRYTSCTPLHGPSLVPPPGGDCLRACIANMPLLTPPPPPFTTAGEMVLLLHWSLLNYAAVVKILKKHGERQHPKAYNLVGAA